MGRDTTNILLYVMQGKSTHEDMILGNAGWMAFLVWREHQNKKSSVI